ncbi:MAG: Flp family type IVb pilin [Acidimicrobiia bacterium]
MLHLLTALQSRIVREEEGAGMVEYALLIALIGIILIAAIGVLTGAIGDVFTEVSTSIQ